MIYIEYEELKSKYYDIQKEYDTILSRKEQLFNMTQPKATNITNERVNGGTPANTFDEYVIKKEKEDIDNKLKEVASILNDRKMLLDMKLDELDQSKDWNDIIYKYNYIYHLSARKIEKRIPFSKSEICRKLEKIRNNINLGQKGTKGIVR